MGEDTLVAPSILAADFSRLGEEVEALDAAGADWIHIDVMDGHFVPNITIGPSVVAALRDRTDLPFDVHLMIAPVEPYLADFVGAGADSITVHVEAGAHTARTVAAIREIGVRAGVSLCPGTPVAAVEPLLDTVDLVLVMSVNPGFGGQRFMPGSIDRVAALADMIGDRPIHIEVDGGIGPDEARKLAAAGADVLVAGSSVMRDGPDHYADRIAALRPETSGV